MDLVFVQLFLNLFLDSEIPFQKPCYTAYREGLYGTVAIADYAKQSRNLDYNFPNDQFKRSKTIVLSGTCLSFTALDDVRLGKRPNYFIIYPSFRATILKIKK